MRCCVNIGYPTLATTHEFLLFLCCPISFFFVLFLHACFHLHICRYTYVLMYVYRRPVYNLKVVFSEKKFFSHILYNNYHFFFLLGVCFFFLCFGLLVISLNHARTPDSNAETLEYIKRSSIAKSFRWILFFFCFVCWKNYPVILCVYKYILAFFFPLLYSWKNRLKNVVIINKSN